MFFFFFWIGIIIGYENGQVTIAEYSKAQISCTVVPHFIMPILFLVIPSCHLVIIVLVEKKTFYKKIDELV